MSEEAELNDGLVVCPFCAEEIKAAAIKCRYCGSFVASNEVDKITEYEDWDTAFDELGNPVLGPNPNQSTRASSSEGMILGFFIGFILTFVGCFSDRSRQSSQAFVLSALSGGLFAIVGAVVYSNKSKQQGG